MIIRPPAKFCSVPLSAMPMAMPPAASRAAREEVLTPSAPTATMIRMTVRAMDTKLEMNEAIARSVLRRSNIFRSPFLMRLMIQAPTM